MEKASVLLLDPNPWSQQITKQILFGFGVRTPFVCENPADAREILEGQDVNLLVISDVLGETTGYEFVSWMRRAGIGPNSFIPIIIVSGHTKRSNIHAARDCGANFILAKPVSVQVMLERVLWVARDGRTFIDTGKYLGPDRRFRSIDPPDGVMRRRDDLRPGTAFAPGAESLAAAGGDQ
ncbi:MAG: response regulator [Proteobacteria bacterium]|nr:response regulator [Pseudomonadota bacterium]